MSTNNLKDVILEHITKILWGIVTFFVVLTYNEFRDIKEAIVNDKVDKKEIYMTLKQHENELSNHEKKLDEHEKRFEIQDKNTLDFYKNYKVQKEHKEE